MLLFCPQCANALTITQAPATQLNQLSCRTCPYSYALTVQYYERRTIFHPEKHSIFGGEDEYKNAPKIEKMCGNSECAGTWAIFKQQQTRSADEGSTITYLCITCGHQWREYT